MRAVGFAKTGSIENLGIVKLPDLNRNVSAKSVRMKTIACSINHLDLWVLKGLPRVRYEFPVIAGADVCGKVVQSKSAKFKVGDRVIIYPAASSGLDAAGDKAPEN